MAAGGAPLRCIEFFCGMGGLHYGMSGSGVPAEVVACFDINQPGNKTYECNFGVLPQAKSLEFIKPEQLRAYRADCWLMSPPCQPYTVGGSKRDDQDTRARGLIHLFTLLRSLPEEQLPRFILIENVPGFEVSNSRTHVVDALLHRSFAVREYFLTPTQFGFPYDRVRYFMCARRVSVPETSTPGLNYAPSWLPAPAANPATLGDFLEKFEGEEDAEYVVPHEFLLKPKQFRFDIVTPANRKTSCFTKAYGTEHVYGSGAFLITRPGDPTTYDFCDGEALLPLRLRFLTPTEIGRLHGFPSDGFDFKQFGIDGVAEMPGIRFPANFTAIQKYRLLGNSLNAVVIAHLLRHLFLGDTDEWKVMEPSSDSATA